MSAEPADGIAARKRKQEASPDAEMEAADADEGSYQPSQQDRMLMLAASRGNCQEVVRLLNESDADPCYQDLETGMSVLMAASASGSVDTVRALLDAGAPWNALDRKSNCAGEYAIWNKQQPVVDQLLSHAAASELLLATFAQADRQTDVTDLQREYMKNRVTYSGDDQLLDSTGLAVMMAWEKPLMEEHAKYLLPAEGENSDSTVLNIGFGMGIVDTALHARRPKHHTIIEAHPDVLRRMRDAGWMDKPNVTVVQGRWQDKLSELGQFDAVFFDTYAEDDLDLHQFHMHLPSLLTKPQGRYSFYNGMCPDNVFFHAVACEVVRLRLLRLGLECSFNPFPVHIDDPSLWQGVRERYWHFDTYYVPLVKWKSGCD